jgi:hypothetical protein
MPTTGPSKGSLLLAKWRGERTQVLAASVLELDVVTYNRFEHGVRRPRASKGFEIERLTKGAVPAKSWYELPIKKAKE